MDSEKLHFNTLLKLCSALVTIVMYASAWQSKSSLFKSIISYSNFTLIASLHPLSLHHSPSLLCLYTQDCLKPFTDGCFMELEGRPLCSLHFHSRQGTLCGGCSEPITGRCISALDRKFHPEHFVCAFCLRQLSQGIFKEQTGKPYCSACFNKLFV